MEKTLDINKIIKILLNIMPTKLKTTDNPAYKTVLLLILKIVMDNTMIKKILM